MSQFQLDKDLEVGLRLEESVNHSISKKDISLCNTPGRGRTSNTNNSFLNSSRNASTSRLLSAVSSGLGPSNATIKHRSHSASRATPSKGFSNRSTSPSRVVKASNDRGGDRFIPNRSAMDMEMAQYSILYGNKKDQENDPEVAASYVDQQRQQMMANVVLGKSTKTRILAFQSKVPMADANYVNSMKEVFSAGKAKTDAAKIRQVSSRAEKILDAPDLLDDFYLHQLDWSVNNHMAVALVSTVYVWNASEGSITELLVRENESDIITALSWVREGNILAVGDTNGDVQIWDVTSSKLMRTMQGHTDRVPVLRWNDHILASGCKTGQTWLHDVRVAQHHVATLAGHTQEVCGMDWSPDRGGFLATGSNDNNCLIWDPKMPNKPVMALVGHLATTKAIAWCPWQPKILATGGGSNDRTIKFWNTSNGNLIQSVDTKSQVSSIVWNEEYKEVASGHGFSHNQIICWKYPTMTKVAELKGHTSRILLLLKSPDGSTVASAAGDETVRIWNLWPKMTKKVCEKPKGRISLFTQIR